MNIDTFLRAMPGLSSAKAQQYLGPMEAAEREFGVTTVPRARMWLAQVGHESASLVYFEELASGAAYEGRADHGNTQPGDGVRFKGRGPIQITGRANYAQAGQALGLPLVQDPPMAADPRYAFRVSAWWWKTHGLNELADAGDVVGATRRINGGLNGLTDRQQRFDRCQALGNGVLPGDGSTPRPGPAGRAPTLHVDYFGPRHNQGCGDVRVWQQRMRERGKALAVDGIYGSQSEAVCRSFQQEKRLPVDGLVGPQTWRVAWS